MRYKLAVPQRDGYPWRALRDGLAKAGLVPVEGFDVADVLVTWSPWEGSWRRVLVDRHPIVIVVENGWLTPIQGVDYYQVALWGWNGTGVWRPPPPNGPDRRLGWAKLVSPHETYYQWDGPALVIEQTGHREDARTAPKGWADDAARQIPNAVIRRKGATTPLLDELKGSRALVTWSSNAAAWAHLAGIPVYYAGPTLMTWELAHRWRPGTPLSPKLAPLESEVDEVFYRLAWAQWSEAEIRTAIPLRRLL